MVRPRGGPMVFSEDEAQIIMDDAASLKMEGADGLVFGALNMDGTVNQKLSKQLIQVIFFQQSGIQFMKVTL